MPPAPRLLLVNPTITSRHSARFPLALLHLSAALERSGAGSRIIDGFAKKMADEFFTRFQAAVEGPAPEDVPAEAAAETGEDDGTGEQKKGWFRRLIG